MDANNQAAFQSVAEGINEKVCPACSAKNEGSAKFCFSCGQSMIKEDSDIQAPAFTPAKPVVAAAPAAVVYEEPESVFAKGLPSWSLEPPQVVVRRRGAK